MGDSANDTYLGPHASLSEMDAILLSAYLDGELSAEERAQLEIRLAEEPPLKKEWEKLKAEHDLVLAADPSEKKKAKQVSGTFSDFGSKLAIASPSDLPIAPALKPPRLKRALTIISGVFLALILLGTITDNSGRKQWPTWSVWSTGPTTGEVTIHRAGKKLNFNSGWKLKMGDLLEVKPDATITLSGPANLKCTLTGPARMTWRSGEMVLESGIAKVEAPNREAIEALNLSTPDGGVLPDPEAEQLTFEINVE